VDRDPPIYSVVVPVMNEEENVPVLAHEIADAMNRTGARWECVWINDGSTDGTQAALDGLADSSSQHRIVELDGNFGQSAALAAGFGHAKGEFVGTLDGDGQNDPADLPGLFAALRERGVDMINGVRAKRRDSAVRRLSSRIGNGFRNRMTGEHVTDVGCSLRVFRRECVSDLPVFRGMHRFLPTLVRMKGYRVEETPVSHRPRLKGKTKYGIGNRLWVGLADTFAVVWMQKRLVWPRVRRVRG
jgi:dolichol-phosphate mannosyltransferase